MTLDKDIRGKTGRFQFKPDDYPLVGKPFGRKFYYKDENGQRREMPHSGMIDDVLGTGGFGAVYRLVFEMHHPWRKEMKFGTYGAVKLLDKSRPDLINNDEAIKRFKREGKIGLALRLNETSPASESLTFPEDYPESLIKTVELQETEGGDPYILMEYIDHPEPLSSYVKVNPKKDEKINKLPLDEALYTIKSLVDAVDYMHRRGIYHRDIKPGNLVRNSKTKKPVKLVDFGLSTMRGLPADIKSMIDADDATLDELTQQVKGFRGSVWYTSPEVAAITGAFSKYAKELDIWGVGAAAYALLAGFPPYTGTLEDHMAIRTQISRYDKEHYNRKEDVVFLKEVAPEVPWPVNDWVMECLNKEIERRPVSERLKPKLDDVLAKVGYGE